jgi:hypothetical protein
VFTRKFSQITQAHKFGISLILILIFPLATESTASQKPFEQYRLSFPNVAPGEYGYTAANFDDSITTETHTYLSAVFRTSATSAYGAICKTTSDPKCQNSDPKSLLFYGFVYNATLKHCETETETNCIASVTAIDRAGNEVKGSFYEYVLKNYPYTYPGDSEWGIPEGSTASIWKFPGIAHQGGDEFALNFVASGSGRKGEPTVLSGAIYPMSRKVGQFLTPEWSTKVSGPGSFGGTVEGGWQRGTAASDCVLSISTTQCVLPWPHPEGIEYQVELRLERYWNITKFIYGRLSSPSVNNKFNERGNQIFTIRAKPMKVPVISGWRKNSEISTDLNTALEKFFNGGIAGGTLWGDGLSKSDRSKLNWDPMHTSYDSRVFNLYQLWLKEFKDQSSGTKSIWFMRTLRVENSSDSEVDIKTKTGKCLESSAGFSGLVASNAGMYITGPPVFNETTATLDYKVSSPHFDENGAENVGSYDLIIKSDVARCIYGFSNAPIQGSISVVDAEGNARVATTVVREKDGFLYLSANGFTYSAPILKVKLTQPAIPVIAAKVVQVKKTISCTKGKTIKKVTAINPKCPKGYKKR